MRVRVIVNPAAGMGRARKVGREIAALLKEITEEQGIKFDIVYTLPSGENSATNLAREAVKRGFQRIIAVGGDGTINEVVNGIGESDVILGIIPAGVGNDFAKALNLPKNPKRALNSALFNEEILVDLGRSNGRLFVNVVSFGIDAKITQSAANLKIRYPFLPREGVYLLALFRELLFPLEYPQIHLCLLKEGVVTCSKESILLAVANGSRYGGMFKIAPEANLRDGLFEICWIQKMGRIKILLNLYRFILGTHAKLKEVRTLRTSCLSVLAPNLLPCEMDGEILEAKREYKITVVPKALKVVVPSQKEVEYVPTLGCSYP